MNLMSKPPLGQKAPKDRFTPTERRYYRWLHLECVCCLTGFPAIELAHTGGIAQGKGMGRKAPVKTVLPLRMELHHIEERLGKDRQDGKRKFWKYAGFPDYLMYADQLHELFETNQDPRYFLADMQGKASREFLTECLL